jgi:predicted  nucleic acid-binding Zn-ribbon protein
MKESLHRLLDLQKIDKEIGTLERSKEEFPGEIDRLKSELESARKSIQETVERVSELERGRRAMEGELETISQDLKKHQDRLYEVKSNREYDALQLEIESLGNRKEEQETGILQSLEDFEDLSTKLGEDKSAFSQRESEIQEHIDELESKLGSVEGDIKGWMTKRRRIEKGVDAPALSSYDRIRRIVKGGVAAVAVKKGSCGGCFRQLSPQLLVEARRTDKLLRCENCGRMLVWKDEVLV